MKRSPTKNKDLGITGVFDIILDVLYCAAPPLVLLSTEYRVTQKNASVTMQYNQLYIF